MKNKIEFIIYILLSLIIILSFIFIIKKNNNQEIYIPKKEEVKTQISGFNGLSFI